MAKQAPPAPTTEQKRNAGVILRRLAKRYDAATALHYEDPWQLLVVTTLSAQTTDEMVNQVAPLLFERWPSPGDLGTADPEEVEKVIYSTGFFRQKTKSVIGLSAALDDRHDGEVPVDLDALTELPGVGRKTASVVLAEAFDVPAIAVDTHVKRVTRRLGLTTATDPVKIEFELRALYPRPKWAGVSMRFIAFGREFCQAKVPECWHCPMEDRCPYPDKTPPPGE